MNVENKSLSLGIIGLGYVGLPLAVEFGKIFNSVGFDINEKRINDLKENQDITGECSEAEIKDSQFLKFSSNLEDIKDCNVYIITVPTPIDADKKPDLSPLIKASKMLSPLLKKDDVVIYESTVYPGATEDDCVPRLEEFSTLEYNKDFFVGYSPERINPGDKERRVSTIKKVTSGSTEDTANFVDELYSLIITAGTFKASSIRVAEASKVIENVQRDVNIALINELHHIFDIMGISTREVIEAASTKWNFMKLMPGLVGGHCISVDPYYLLHKSCSVGYIPDLIRTARVINDGMADFVANSFVNKLIQLKINPISAKILLLGFSFKENCPDLRNTKVVDLYNKLISLGLDVDIYDPCIDIHEAKDEYNITVINELKSEYDVGMMCVGHELIIDDIKSKKISFNSGFIYDFKDILK